VRVLLTHSPEDLEAYYARSLPDLVDLVDVVRNPLDRNLSTPELIEAATGCDVIVSHRSTPGETALFERSPTLVAFLRCAVDLRDVDTDTASRLGIAVGHADKSFVIATAELALGLTLDLARNIAESTIDYRKGHTPPQRPGRQLAGQVAGIIGYGAIGSHLAGLLHGIGMAVLVHDPFVEDVPAPLERVSLDDLLSRADYVFPLAPASSANVDLIDAEALAAMKRGASLVNVSRGELVNEDAVAAALDDGTLGGLAMDVGRAPDQRPSAWLASRAGVVSTPHLGGLTPENADAQAASSVEQVEAILRGDLPPRLVDPDAIGRLRAWWAANR
jgi:D-3-phosphoglycerate dehydrogenase